MVFKKRAETGEIDPRINTAGRIKSDKVVTKRSIRDRELLGLLRKIKPHLSESIMTAASIMKNKEASHMNQLRAATVLLQAYRELVNDAYNGEDPEEEGTEVQPQPTGPVFSLRMVNTEPKEE